MKRTHLCHNINGISHITHGCFSVTEIAKNYIELYPKCGRLFAFETAKAYVKRVKALNYATDRLVKQVKYVKKQGG